MTGSSLRYVALGDSYTIGTAVTPAERWPDQLVAALDARGPRLELVANLAVNGYTARDVIEQELPALAGLAPDFTSLLVGVNDVIQGYTADAYRANLDLILRHLVATVGSHRIVAVTTPDYTVTPAGADYGDIAARAAGIRAFNAVLTATAKRHRVAVVDIHDLSLRAADDRSLVAGDGLHPSGTQYRQWVDRIAPIAAGLLAS